MKKNLLFTGLLTAVLLIIACLVRAQVNDPGQVVQQSATNHANNDMSSGVNNGLNQGENAIKGLFKKKNKSNPAPAPATNANGSNTNGASGTAANAATSGPPTLKVYSNYDFVPGEKIIFEDHFTDEQDGEFPSHWKLTSGQGIMNNLPTGEPAFFLTQGNYVRVEPRMTPATNYLPENFTVEFDFWLPKEGSYPPLLLFSTDKNENRNIQFGKGVNTGYFENNFSADYPAGTDNFSGKWHHAAMIKKGNQIKCYEDQYRVLVIPDCGSCRMVSLNVGGIGSLDEPLVFRNFRIAEGGSMNMIGQKFTDAKIVTHGINFDVDKAVIKPESMGTLNMIVKIMQANPDLKFEVDGHTDNTGDAVHNLTLSQQRADAVKAQLISMGIDASRLTSKGFGQTKPIADNSSFEGKANNRRVEFVKI